MNKIIVRFLGIILGLFIAERLVTGIQVNGLLDAVLFAVCLGILNILIRPILLILAIPITIFTLGLFIFVINASMFLLASYFVVGVHVTGFVPALFGTIIVSCVSWIIQKII